VFYLTFYSLFYLFQFLHAGLSLFLVSPSCRSSSSRSASVFFLAGVYPFFHSSQQLLYHLFHIIHFHRMAKSLRDALLNPIIEQNPTTSDTSVTCYLVTRL
jgi:hypothetical protein